MKRKLLSVPLAPGIKAAANTSHVSAQRSHGSSQPRDAAATLISDKAAQAPTKRRKLLVPGVSQTTQVQSTSNQTNMTTAAAVVAYKDAVHLVKTPDQTKCTQPMSGNIQQPDQHGKGITAAPTSTSGEAAPFESDSQAQRDSSDEQVVLIRTNYRCASKKGNQPGSPRKEPMHHPITPVRRQSGDKCELDSQTDTNSYSDAVPSKESAATAAIGGQSRSVPQPQMSPTVPPVTEIEEAVANSASQPAAVAVMKSGDMSVAEVAAGVKDVMAEAANHTNPIPEVRAAYNLSTSVRRCVRNVPVPVSQMCGVISGKLQVCTDEVQDTSSASPGQQDMLAVPAKVSCTPLPRVPARSTEQAGTGKPETLPMVWRMPAVLTHTLPTAQSLGLQLSMPNGADVLKQLSIQAQCGLPAGSIQRLCLPAVVKGLQTKLTPQELFFSSLVNVLEDEKDWNALSWVLGNNQNTTKSAQLLEGLCKPVRATESLKLAMPVNMGQNIGVQSRLLAMSAVPADQIIKKHKEVIPGKEVCQHAGHSLGDPLKVRAGTGTQNYAAITQLVASQQIEFADMWQSPEKQAQECNKSHDAFGISLSFLQAVLS